MSAQRIMFFSTIQSVYKNPELIIRLPYYLRPSSCHVRGRLQLPATEEGTTISKQYPFTIKALKALCVRHLFHQERWWTESSIANFLGEWRKTSGANLQKVGETTPALCNTTTIRLARRPLCGSCWLLRTPQPPQSPYLLDLTPCDFFPFPKMKLRFKGRLFSTEKIQIE